jgi:deoxyribonuclease V
MMKIRRLHPFSVSPKKAVEIQRRLQPLLDLETEIGRIRSVAGTDISFSKKSDTLWAGVVVLSYPELSRLEQKWIRGKATFPYIPGLLSFREIPLLLKALERVERDPELIFCDGQGIAHPRGLGIASHLGLLVNKPSIGCAKSRLIGDFSGVGNEKGDYTLLRAGGEVIGAVLRTRTGVKPLFVSPGNGITLEKSIRLTLSCCLKYRIPEPIRQAHLLVNRIRREEGLS